MSICKNCKALLVPNFVCTDCRVTTITIPAPKFKAGDCVNHCNGTTGYILKELSRYHVPSDYNVRANDVGWWWENTLNGHFAEKDLTLAAAKPPEPKFHVGQVVRWPANDNELLEIQRIVQNSGGLAHYEVTSRHGLFLQTDLRALTSEEAK